MDYQFINITTYRGISSNAEHFYATIGENSYAQENLISMLDGRPNTGISYGDIDLVHYPTLEEAKVLFLKYHFEARNRELMDIEKKRIAMDVEDGVHQFPSILSIVEESKKKFPNSVLCFSLNGSVKDFVRWMHRNKDSEQVKKIIDILL